MRRLQRFRACVTAFGMPPSGRVTNGFDIVSVGVENERAVIIRMVVRAQARSAVVLAARGDRRTIERIDVRPRVGAKRDMNRRNIGLALADPEIRLRRHAEACELFPFHQHSVSERRERGTIERLAPGDIRYADSGVIDHASPSILTRPQTRYS